MDDHATMVAMMDEEDAYDADDQENLSVVIALRQLQLDAEKKKPKRGGSKPGRRKSKKRQRLEGHAMLFQDYFA